MNDEKLEDAIVTRNVALHRQDYEVVARVALERGLGSKGFSAAMRMIIREWAAQHAVLVKPVVNEIVAQ